MQPTHPSLPFDARFERVRWTLYGVLVVAYMSVYFHRMAPAVVAGDLMAAFHTSGAALGSLAAMYYYIYTLMQIPAGVLADTIGNRAVATVGNLIAGVGSLIFAFADDFALASTGRLLVGLGVSVIFVGLMKSNTVWFSERNYGLVSGLTLFLGNLGSVLAAGPLAEALKYYSWREVFTALGAGSLLLGALSLAFVRNRPEDVGLPSVRAREGKAEHAGREHPWWRELISVATTAAVWPGFFLKFGLAGSFFAFIGLWAVPLLRDVHGLDRSGAALYTTVALAAFAVGSLLAGALSDRLRRRRPVLMAGAAGYALTLLLIAVVPWGPGPSGIALFAAMGLSAGGFVVGYACAKEVCPPAVSGMAISLVNTGLFLGAALMQPLFGWLLDLGWSGVEAGGVRVYGAADYARGWWLMIGFAAVACAATLFVRETRCRNITPRGPEDFANRPPSAGAGTTAPV